MPDPLDRHDTLTCAAVALVAWSLANVLHEGLGHGGACWLAGCRPEMLNAVFFAHDDASVTDGSNRWIAAAGSLVNLAAAAIALATLRMQRLAPAARLFAWLFAAINLLMAFGYLMFSGIGNIGDWARVVREWQPAWAWRVALAVAGAALYFVVAPALLRGAIAPLLGREDGRALWQTVRLPYLVGGALFIIAGLLNPYSLQLVLISAAAASFGGGSLLAWYPFDKFAGSAPTRSTVRRSWPWCVAGAACAAFFIGVLGPGIALH